MRKRILLLTNTLKTGGAEKQCTYLFNELKKLEETYLIVYYGDQCDQRMLNLYENFDNVLFLKEKSHLKKIYFIYKFIKTNRINVIISYLATVNVINGFVGFISGVKVRIGGIRSSNFNRRKFLIQKHVNNYLLSATIFNNKKGFCYSIENGFNINKSHQINNAIKLPSIKKTHKKGKINILTVGRFVKDKDYFTALKVIDTIREHNIIYTIVGFGVLENEIRNEIYRLNLEKKVSIVINPVSIEEYYNDADIYLSTSINEGLSNSIMEAMSFGLPIVATDVGDTSILVSEKNGYLTNISNYLIIAQCIIELLDLPEVRSRKGKNSLEIINRGFSVDRMTEEYSKVINKYFYEKN